LNESWFDRRWKIPSSLQSTRSLPVVSFCWLGNFGHMIRAWKTRTREETIVLWKDRAFPEIDVVKKFPNSS
jgi:hypothetical protein